MNRNAQKSVNQVSDDFNVIWSSFQTLDEVTEKARHVKLSYMNNNICMCACSNAWARVCSASECCSTMLSLNSLNADPLLPKQTVAPLITTNINQPKKHTVVHEHGNMGIDNLHSTSSPVETSPTIIVALDPNIHSDRRARWSSVGRGGRVWGAVVECGARWSRGRAADCRSRRPGFETTCCHFKTWTISFAPRFPDLSEERMPGEVKVPTRIKPVVNSVRLIELVISISKLAMLPPSLAVISCKWSISSSFKQTTLGIFIS